MKLILAILLINFILINTKENLRDTSENDTDSSAINDILENLIDNLDNVVDKIVELDLDEDQLAEEDIMLNNEDLNKIKQFFFETEDKIKVEEIKEEDEKNINEDNEDQSLWPETPEPQYKFIV